MKLKYLILLKQVFVCFFICNVCFVINIQASTKKRFFKTKIYNLSDRKFYRFFVPQHSKIKKWIRFFNKKKGRKLLKKWLRSSQDYSYFIKKNIKKRNMPPVLAYLPMIESGFYVHARSSVGAIGYWQFIKTTAQRFNLKVTHWLDERKNVHKSTHAALDYLSLLYKRFGKWDLALAAYNMGETRLAGFIKKYKTTNYWTLINKYDFPKETKNYIPKLVAITYLLEHPQFYGIKIKHKPKKQKKFNYIFIDGGISLAHLAKSLNITQSYLRKINPELKYFKIPHYVKSYAIRIPPTNYQTIENYFKQ